MRVKFSKGHSHFTNRPQIVSNLFLNFPFYKSPSNCFKPFPYFFNLMVDALVLFWIQ